MTEKEFLSAIEKGLRDISAEEREKTLEFLKTNKLNPFQINKAISKCRDSFRVSKEDKENLLEFRK